ncbi:cytochrome P450 [Sphingomonas ginkgonis]|uniref:Cytochrome P450 n=1 Tax=Sphingomonas ginkgonis TaxID=2315330 RepID=A0A3R9X8K9_9SPHN|nr:cytochrome P450 [Sphingomonas ginkgonis]RST31338.1 cytochrome P450 [Sphingomonas ginkgonis]
MNAPVDVRRASKIRDLARVTRPLGSPLCAPAAADLEHIPGKKGLPWVGVLPEAAADPLLFAQRMHQRFGPVHRFYALGEWNVQLVGPEASELLLFDSQRNFSATHGWSRVLGPLFPGGLLLRDFEDHRVHRRAVGSAFKPDLVAAGLQIFENQTRAMIDRVSGTRLFFYRELREVALEAAALGFLGLSPGADSQEFSLAFTALVSATVAILPGWLPGSSLHRGRTGRRLLEKFINARIAERRIGGGDDLFSQLCIARYDDGTPLTNQEIVDHLIFVLAAAHDTLTSCLASTIYFLAAEPDWQAQVRSECRAAGLYKNDVHANVQLLSELPVTDAVIREALRLNTPAPIIWRRAIRRFEFNGITIPAGTPTATNVLLTHRLPEHWRNPEQFDPHRFLLPAPDRHRFAWTPFGGGVHMCLGLHHAMLHAKSFLAQLLERNEVVLDPGYSPRWYWWPNCRPLDGLPVTLVRLSER